MAKEKRWSQKIAQHDALLLEGAGLLYERVKILQEVHDDPEFRDEMRAQNKDVYEFLDMKLGDTGQTYTVLVAVMEHFPGKHQWQGQQLIRMVAEVMEHDRAKRAESQEKGERTSWKEIAAERGERIKELERENELLKARLDEVERLVGKKLAAA